MPFGKWTSFEDCVQDMMNTQNYDEETAKKVCGKLQAQLGKESFGWVGDIKPFGKLIRGKALHPLKTVHPEEWPSVRVYLEEELQKSAHTLAGKPLLLDHMKLLRGEVLGAEYEDGAIEYVAKLDDSGILDKIRQGKIKHCSVEFEWKSLEQVNGVAPRDLNFIGLSLLKNFAPGDPLTTVDIWEGIVKELKEAKNVRRGGNQGTSTAKAMSTAKEQAEPQEFILYAIRDPAAFLEERFSTAWVDLENGIQAIYGRLREDPENPQPMALLFMKAKGWTIEKMQGWLQDHSQYLRQSQPATAAPAGIQSVSPMPPTAQEGVMKMSDQGGGEPPKAGEPKTDKQRFMDHFGLTEEQVDTLLEILGEVIYKLLPERGAKTAKEQSNDENDEQEKLRQAQKVRAEKYGISPKEGGHLTKPSEYEDVPEDQFADPVNYRYPVTEKYVKGALTYFNQPDNREAGGYTHEEAVKIMTKIINAALNAGIEVSWQAEDPVYRDLPEELKKKLTGYEEPSQTATEQQGDQEPEKDEHGCIIGKERYDEEQGKCVPIATEEAVKIVTKMREAIEQAGDLTVEEIKQKIVELAKQKEDLENKLWPEAPPSLLSDEERATIQAQIDVLYAEIEAFEQALATKITGQAAPPETPSRGTVEPEKAAEKKKGLGEAIIEPGAPQQPTFLVPVEKLEAKLPPLQAERSMSWGAQRFVQDVKRLIREAKEVS